MGVITGKLGAVNGVPCIRSWGINDVQNVQTVIASCTDGATGAIPGNNDWSGTFSQFTGSPTHLPGDTLSFAASMDGVNGLSGPVIVDSITINWDIESGAPIECITAFSANGALTYAANTDSDATLFDQEDVVSKGSILKHGPTAIVTRDDLRTMTMTLTADNKSYVSSSTAGETKRLAGNISGTVSATVYEDDLSNLPSPGSYEHWKMFVGVTLFWEIKWILINNLSGIEINRESGDLVGATINGMFSAFDDTTPAPVKGTIEQPGAVPVNYWGD